MPAQFIYTGVKNLKKVRIYTDGACSGNPGAGGWAAILEYNGIEKEISGYEENTTNNRMELTAVIEALSLLKEPCLVHLFSDSKYIADAVEKGWAVSWRNNGWKKADKKEALNTDLWERLLNLLEKHSVKIEWVKGHSGDTNNERCDKLAVSMIENKKST